MKAEFIKNIEGWRGDASLYKCGDVYFIVSAVNNVFAHETMAFAADEHGNLTDGWMDVACIDGVMDHKSLLQQMGYELA